MKHSVITWLQNDRPGVLLEMLNLLNHAPTHSSTPNARINIDMLDVKKFGPLGQVMIRFSTENDRALDYIEHIARAPGSEYVCTRAGRPISEDASVTHQVWEYVLPEADATNSTHHEFASIIAGHGGIELAQRISTRLADNTNNLYQFFRYFDHLGRGEEYLKHVIVDAFQILHDLKPQRLPSPRCRQLILSNDDEIERLLSWIARRDGHIANPKPLLYLCVHTRDFPGSYVLLSRFFQFEPTTTGTDPRALLNGGCRSMGDQGVILLAANPSARGDPTAEAQELQDRLQGYLHNILVTGSSNPYMPIIQPVAQSIHHAKVLVSAEQPCAMPQGHASIRFAATRTPDGPNLIRNLCLTVDKASRGTANYYYLDAHRGIGVGKNIPFILLAGISVPDENGLPRVVADAIENQLQNDSWEIKAGPTVGA